MIRLVFRPLVAWPPDRPVTKDRQRDPFDVPMDRVWRYLLRELDHLGVSGDAVLEASFAERDITVDGSRPRADAPTPKFPGVILSANTKHGAMRWPCDSCLRWQDNVRAIALHLQRLREIEKYGVAVRGEQYAGWRALPAPGQSIVTPPPMTVEEAARFVSKVSADERGSWAVTTIIDDAEQYRDAYRRAAFKLHPDRNTGFEENDDWRTLARAKAALDAHHHVK